MDVLVLSRRKEKFSVVFERKIETELSSS